MRYFSLTFTGFGVGSIINYNQYLLKYKTIKNAFNAPMKKTRIFRVN